VPGGYSLGLFGKMVLTSLSEVDRRSPTILKDDIEEKKNAMTKSLKSGLFDIGVHRFSYHVGSLFMS
jgi:hypothetical protein